MVVCGNELQQGHLLLIICLLQPIDNKLLTLNSFLLSTGTRRWEPAKYRSGPVHINGENHGPQHRIEGNHDGSCSENDLVYSWHWGPSCADG